MQKLSEGGAAVLQGEGMSGFLREMVFSDFDEDDFEMDSQIDLFNEMTEMQTYSDLHAQPLYFSKQAEDILK